MQELGFRRNVVGRALASKRTRIIALLFPALQHSFSGTVVHFFTSAAAAARELGYNLVLWPISNDAGQTTELTSSGLVDGVILMEILPIVREDNVRGGVPAHSLHILLDFDSMIRKETVRELQNRDSFFFHATQQHLSAALRLHGPLRC